MENKKYISNNEKDTKKIAKEFTKKLKGGDVVFVMGDLGSGKTTFVKGLAEAFGINSRILSPTFSLLRSHKIENHEQIKNLHHVDLYRVSDEDKTIEEILKEFSREKNGIMLIEWAKENTNLTNNWVVKIEDNKTNRTITIQEKEDSLIFNKDEICVFPTDTAFGIGCRIDDEKSIKKLFTLRKRPHDKAVPVLVSSINMAKKYGHINTEVDNLAKKFWPGGLTIVVKAKQDMVPQLVIGGGSTIGLRMPNHPQLLSLIEKTGVPILGPSANFAGEPTPYTKEEVNPQLIKLVDSVLPGETSKKSQSTVIDTTQKPWKILREGAIKSRELKNFI